MAATLPPGTTTAIGSLPHTDAGAAVRFVLESGCDVPFWPQLPKRDFREGMVPQYASALPGFTVDEVARRCRVRRGEATPEKLTAFYERALDPAADFPLDEGYAAGFFEFVKRAGAVLEKPAFVKGQVTGPLTFLLGLNLEDGRPIHTDEELRSCAVMLLAKNAAWQAKTLRPLAREGVIIFIDEPIYSALGTVAYLSIKADDVRATVNEVAEAAHGEGALVGIHCCGSADWETVLSTEIDVLAFDACGYTDSLAVYAKALPGFLERGGVLAFGIVPTGTDEIASADENTVFETGDAALSTFAGKGVDRELMVGQSMLTPSCGCGALSIEHTEKVFRLLRAAGERWGAGP